MNKFPNCSSVEQTVKLNELLGGNESYYTLSDVFKFTPSSIEIDGHRGDRFISDFEISYSNVDSNFKLSLIKVYQIPLDGDIYDAFISCLTEIG